MPLLPDYDRNVFINCPFDDAYQPLFRAIIFTVYAAGGHARSGLEVSDAGEVRITKILRMIEDCRLGIHDISRTELDAATRLPRFNMPLELGLFLGCQRFGSKRHKNKSCLILDREPYRFRAFISDIAGQDPESHDDNPLVAIRCVRDWLRTATGNPGIAGAAYLIERYQGFQAALPQVCADLVLDHGQLTYADYTHVVTSWIRNAYRQ